VLRRRPSGGSPPGPGPPQHGWGGLDSEQGAGSVHQSGDGLVWHNHYRLDRTLETAHWEAQIIGRLLGTHTIRLVCVHGAHMQGGGLQPRA
jgi:hypothetical protein